MARDVLDDLLQRAIKAQKRRVKQAELEAEAAERVEKKRKIEELNAAFDAERFRFLAASLPQYAGLEVTSVRKLIDDEMERSIIKDFNQRRRGGSH